MENEPAGPGTKDWRDFGCHVKEHVHCHGCGSAIYWVGFLGALVYYIQAATSLWTGIIGVLKAIVWPAFLVYGALKYLGM